MCVMIGAMDEAESLRNLGGMLSSPVALCGWSAHSQYVYYSMVHMVKVKEVMNYEECTVPP